VRDAKNIKDEFTIGPRSFEALAVSCGRVFGTPGQKYPWSEVFDVDSTAPSCDWLEYISKASK
jgi:hypothetical protein